MALAKRYPGEFAFFANELPDIPETRPVLEKYLKMGAIGIGEQKFPVDCDSKHIELVASIAQEFDVPVLMHFEYKKYNFGLERFPKILEKVPEGELHRPRQHLVGKHRQEPRPRGHVSGEPGYARGRY